MQCQRCLWLVIRGFDFAYKSLLTKLYSSVPSKLCACARAHRFQRLRTRINLLRTDILLLRHIVVDQKITIIRQTINFSGAKTAPIQAEDLFFGLHVISDTKTASILCEFQKKCVHAKVCAHRGHKKLERSLLYSIAIISKINS